MRVNIIPKIVDKLRRCIAMVENGDTCTISGGIAGGKWIIWKGGLYQTSEPISYGSSFAVGTNLIAKDGGIGNQLQTQISELNSKFTTEETDANGLLCRASKAGGQVTISITGVLNTNKSQWETVNRTNFSTKYRPSSGTPLYDMSGTQQVQITTGGVIQVIRNMSSGQAINSFVVYNVE